MHAREKYSDEFSSFVNFADFQHNQMQLPIPDHREALKKNHSKSDVVARWVIPIRGRLYDVEFEHGTLSGKRVIWINGEEAMRRDLMYRLVGEDVFFIEEKRCILHVKF